MGKRSQSLRSFKESEEDRQERLNERVREAAESMTVTRAQVQMLQRVRTRAQREADAVPA